jgi:hypothetical protein
VKKYKLDEGGNMKATGTTPTLIENIYNGVKLLFDNQAKEFKSVEDAEEWAESNGVKIKVYHKAGSFVGDNLKEKNHHRDDSARYKATRW